MRPMEQARLTLVGLAAAAILATSLVPAAARAAGRDNPGATEIVVEATQVANDAEAADQGTYGADESRYQGDLESLGVDGVQLSGDIDNLVATIARYGGYKMPKLPVDLYGKDTVKNLVKILSAFPRAARLVPTNLGKQRRTLLKQAQETQQRAQKADNKAHTASCTGP